MNLVSVLHATAKEKTLQPRITLAVSSDLER